ncbi:MAG: GntR family transcriptional regulator [Burkholderiales bacterium]|nr:GntR family transcriptional regulator [Burkholderiales bacterium]
MASLRQIEFTPDLTEQVHQRLLDAICGGELAPETRLTQEDLALRFDVSRQPVLQALRLLKKDGFVIDAGRRGLMVAPLDAATILHVYEVRAVLDGLAARKAAEAGAKLDQAIIAQGRKTVAGGHVGAMIDADADFHAQIYRASGNPMLPEAAGHHWRHIRRAMGAVLQSARARDGVWNEHEAILAAIAARDGDRAERLARDHAEAAGRNLAAEYDRKLRAAS